MPKKRPNDRQTDQLRPHAIISGIAKFAEGSAQIDVGDTRVLVTATVENRVPRFKLGSGEGWVTAEYSMLPRATHTRSPRPGLKTPGRNQEIQRLIGRSLRSSVDLAALGERTVTLDCDVLQADGGTRTAAISAAWVALVEGLGPLFIAGELRRWPLIRQVTAVSVGIVDGEFLLDLEYCEDSIAAIDLNVVMAATDELIEVQGTGEQRSFSRKELDRLLDLAAVGGRAVAESQLAVVADLLKEVSLRQDGSRRRAPAKSEKDVWGAPRS